MTVNRDSFFAAVKPGDRFVIRDAQGVLESQAYTATSEAQRTDGGDRRVTFAYPVEQTRAPGALRWSRCEAESFEIVEG